MGDMFAASLAPRPGSLAARAKQAKLKLWAAVCIQRRVRVWRRDRLRAHEVRRRCWLMAS